MLPQPENRDLVCSRCAPECSTSTPEPGRDSQRITGPGWDPEGSGVLLSPQGPRRVTTEPFHQVRPITPNWSKELNRIDKVEQVVQVDGTGLKPLLVKLIIDPESV
jgi:hypothetical protein